VRRRFFHQFLLWRTPKPENAWYFHHPGNFGSLHLVYPEEVKAGFGVLLVCTLATSAWAQVASWRRDISEKQAAHLLRAFLPHAVVEKSGDMGYPDFHYFMAILGSSSGIGEVGVLQVRYYAVDRKTGDVWNSVICQRITSPSLRKLQGTLRKSIGLTDTEYQKIKRDGPMCEPGMPRVPDEQ
jgi:hypothetical protein